MTRLRVPRPRSIAAVIWWLSLLAIGLFTLFSATLFLILRDAAASADMAARTEEAVNGLRALNDDMLNAETGQRGYLLTLDEAYLAPFTAVSGNGKRRLEQIRGLTDIPVAEHNIDRLIQLFGLKMTELNQTVAEARAGHSDIALALVREGKGRRLMEEFRQIHAETIALEARAMQHYRQRNIAQLRYTLLISLGGGGLAAGLLILSATGVTARLRRDLDGMARGLEAVTTGDLTHRVPVPASRDIGLLATAFNNMAEHAEKAEQARDATQEKLERSLGELERSNRELDGFAYVASHDLRAPLRGIRNLVDWVDADIRDIASADTLENLRLLHNRVDRLDMLLDALLQYSRVGRGGSPPEEVDTGRLVEGIIDCLAPKPGFRVVAEGPLPVLHANKAPLEQTLRNLIGNALKHHEGESGLITISAEDQGDCVAFRIADDGPGIAPAFHERIFQMFQTLKPRDKVEGSGMGLAIVKKAVETNGGTIRVDSAPPRPGAVFTVTWPKTAA